MALPVITNNSPAAGSIAWSAFGITFNGTQYPVAAGNTDKAFVYWAYNGGSPLLVTTNTLPPALAPEDYFLFLNKTGIGMLVDAAQVTDGSMIVSGSIYAAAIAANQINSNHIVAGSIDTTKLAANSVTANEIAANAVGASEIAAGAIQAGHVSAGSITAEKLSVGTVSDNMVVNGSFEDFASGMPVGWEKSAETNGTIVTVTGVNSSGAISVRFDATATTANLRMRQSAAQYIPVSAASSRKYYLSARMAVSVATTQGNWLRANFYDANKVFISSADVRSNAALTTAFTLYEGQVTPPATARYMGVEVLFYLPNVVSQMFLDEVTVHEVTMAAQIGDGQITTAKILAGNVTTDRLAAGAVTADKIKVADFTNYAIDGFFNDTTKANWNGSGTIVTSTTEPNKLRVVTAASGNNDQASKHSFTVLEGEKYYGEMYVYGAVTNVGGGGPNLHLAVKMHDGSTQWPTFQSTTRAAVQGAWTKLSGIVTIPTNARTAIVEPAVSYSADAVGNTYDFRQITVRRMSAGELIVDGSIIAGKIATNAVEADKIAANAVTAGKILAGEIGTNHLAANAITAGKIAADAIDGKTITGATVRTAATGARVVMDVDGLRAFDANEVEYLTADETGLSMVGTVIADGETSELTPRPMEAIMGNWEEGYAGQTPPGLHFKRGDRVDPELYPRVVSADGESITIASGNDPAGVTGGPTIESKLDIYHSGAFLTGQDTVEMSTDALPGYAIGRVTIRSGDRFLEPAGIDITHGGGPVKISGTAVRINSREVHETYLPFVANSYTERDALFDPTWGPFLVEGTSCVRTDLGGVTQRYTNGAWRESEAREWFALTLSGSWAAYAGGGGYYGGLRYRLEGHNVHIQGMIKNGTVPSTVATLPAGFRPEYTHIVPVSCGTGTTPRQFGHLVVSNAGTITYDSGPSAPSFVSIDLVLAL